MRFKTVRLTTICNGSKLTDLLTWHQQRRKREKRWGLSLFCFLFSLWPRVFPIGWFAHLILLNTKPSSPFNSWCHVPDRLTPPKLCSSKRSVHNKIMHIRPRVESSCHLLIPTLKTCLTKLSPYTFIVVFSCGSQPVRNFMPRWHVKKLYYKR